jgi:hypothetical protein
MAVARRWRRSRRDRSGHGMGEVVTAPPLEMGVLNVPPTFTCTPHFHTSPPQIVFGIPFFCIQGSLETVRDSSRSLLTPRTEPPLRLHAHENTDRVFKTSFLATRHRVVILASHPWFTEL